MLDFLLIIRPMHIINTLLPVFLIIALGAFLRHLKFFSNAFVRNINKLTYWVGLPTLLFYKIANASYGYEAASKTALVLASGMISCIIISVILCKILKIPAYSIGAFIQGAFRGNLIYIGLPIVIYSFHGQPKEVIDIVSETTILSLALIVPLYNITAVISILASQHKIDRYVPLKILNQIARNPLIIACFLGAIYSMLFGQLPLAITRTCESIGTMALPLALLSIGATLIGSRDYSSIKTSIIPAMIKTFFAPLAGFPVAIALDLSQNEMQIVLIMLACPTAISSFVLAEQLGSNKILAASIVVITSLLSIISFSTILAFVAH